MWQAIKAFFSAPLGKAGALTAIKVWQVALAVTLVTASVASYTYIRLSAPSTNALRSDMAQEVVVFIGGLNTTMTDCHEDTFDDDTHSNILSFLLSQAVNIANPYAKGCNALDPNRSYFSEPRTIMRFSYNGGEMNPHGYWKPYDYLPCTTVNQFPLEKDVQTFDTMLDKYHQVFPNAHFIIVGHSLGGLVGLQGAYDYIVNRQNKDIDKVITIDSPLKGIQVGNPALAISTFLGKHCNNKIPLSGSVVSNDLVKLGQGSIGATHADLLCDNPKNSRMAVLSWCKGQLLAQQGIGVITLGNEQDSLYCDSLKQAGVDFNCDTQELGTAHLVLSDLYNLTPLPTEGFEIGNLWDTSLAAGHFTLIETPEREIEIVRYILAPVVTIHQPTLQDSALVSLKGTTVPYTAVVHCLWGTANHATARVLLKDGTDLLIGTGVPASSDDTLTIQGVVNLPLTEQNTTGMLYIEADNTTCQYPAGIDPQVHAKGIPSDSNYFGGKTHGVAFSLSTGSPSVQIYSSSSQTQQANSTDDAKLLAQSAPLTTPGGQSFSVYFDYENTGNTIWSDANNYQVICDKNSAPDANCMGGTTQGLNGVQVPPGYQATFYLTLTAPITPGMYRLNWSMARKGTILGRNQGSVVVKVTPTPVVYFGVKSGVYALLAANKKQIWHYQIPAQSGNSLSIQSLIVVGKTVYINTNDGKVYALNTVDGTPLWQSQFAPSNGAVLKVVDGRVYVFSVDGTIYALNANDGSPLWHYQYSSTGGNYTAGVVDNGTIYIGSSDGNVYALNAANGSLLWNFRTENPSDTVFVGSGIICVASQPADVSDFSESFYGLRPSDGKQLWYFHIDSYGNDPYPVVGNGMVYIGTIDTLDVLDANTGSLSWQQKVEIVNGMTLANGIIYVSAGDGGVYAYNADTGTPLWNQPAGLNESGPLAANKIVYVGTRYNGRLIAFGATTGKILWNYQAKSYQPDGAFVTILDVAYGNIYIDDGRYIIVFNMSSGALLWQFDHGFGGGFPELYVSMDNS